MKKTKNVFGITVLAPVALIIVVAALIVVLSYGQDAILKDQTVSFLDDIKPGRQSGLVQDTVDYSITFDGESPNSVSLANITAEILDEMGLSYNKINLRTQSVEFEKCRTMLHCSGKLSIFGSEFADFAEWIGDNNFVWLCMPEYEDEFCLIYRLLGVSCCVGTFFDDINGISFPSNFVFGLKDEEFENLNLGDVSLQLSLESNCEVHMRDLKHNNPLIWSCEHKNGTQLIVFNNNLMYQENEFTGMISAAVAYCNETLLWPIINASVVFIDDFPAPQPQGYDDRIKEQYGYDIQSFYMNQWWPDMKKLAEESGYIYTGVLMETYNDELEAPFTVGVDDAILKYYGAELLSLGGEISYHGYNHQPLCLEGFENDYDYVGWPDIENMQTAFQELVRYAEEVFPDITFTAYVPPSNYLSDEGYGMIKSNAKDLRVISGVYYDDEEAKAFKTDFEESSDGSVYVPRITSGFNIDDDDVIRSYCMLYSEGIFSHFVHPDDVLDEDRGATLGWERLYQCFAEYSADWTSKYSSIRAMTASSCGGAVQRYSRIEFTTDEDDKGITLHLSNFYDEAWFALQTVNEVGTVSGGEAFTMNDDGTTFTWIRCDSDTVRIDWK